MAEEWFYAHEGKEFGPFTTSQLKRLGASGQILPTDLVWKSGMAKRVPARAVKGLCPEAAATAKPRPAAAPQGRTPPPAQPPEEIVELIAVDSPATPTQAVFPTQVDEVVELTAVESVPPTAAPYPPQGHFAPAQPPQPLRAVPVTEAEEAQPYEDDEPRRRSRRRKAQGGSLLWLWLLLGGVGLLLVVGAVVLVIVLAGKGNKVTRENFDKLQTGMAEQDVRDILGSPSMTMTLGMGRTLSWQRGEDVITVSIVNDRVVGGAGVFGQNVVGIRGGPNINIPNFRAPIFGGPKFR
jgi:hypothetical protein